MPFPKQITTVNRAVLNPLMRHLAGRVGPLALVEHVGRKSGRTFRTPVLLFRHGDEAVVALTYGPDVDWARNVLAAESCEVEIRGKWYRATNPRLGHDDTGGVVLPAIVRAILALAKVHDYLRFELRPAT